MPSATRCTVHTIWTLCTSTATSRTPITTFRTPFATLHTRNATRCTWNATCRHEVQLVARETQLVALEMQLIAQFTQHVTVYATRPGLARWINPFEKSRIKPDGLNWLFSNKLWKNPLEIQIFPKTYFLIGKSSLTSPESCFAICFFT